MRFCTFCHSTEDCTCNAEKIFLPVDIAERLPVSTVRDNQNTDILTYSNDKEDDDEEEIGADDLYDLDIKGEYIPDFEQLGKLPPKFIMMLYGRGGLGKSSFCLKLANKVSTPQSKTYYISIEEGNKSMGMQEKLRENGIKNPNIRISKQRDFERILARLRTNEFTNVFVDSATYGKFGAEEIEKIYNIIPGFLLFTLHIKKDGDYKGDSGYQHLVEIEGKIFKAGVISIYKNRTNGKVCTFKFFDADVDTEEVEHARRVGAHRQRRKCFEIVED